MSLFSQLPPKAKVRLRSTWNRCRYPGVQLGAGTYVQRGVRFSRGIATGPDCAVLRGAELREGAQLAARVVIGARSRVARAAVAADCSLEPEVELFNSVLAEHVRLQHGASVTDTHIGRFSYVGRSARLNLVTVGAFCSLGPDVLLGAGDHPVDRGSTSPAFYSTRRQCGATFASANLFEERRPIVVGNDVWIGARAFVRDGVHIADGAIVAAGAIVTHDVPAYAIVGGIPAKLIRLRYSEAHIRRLLAIAWWTWPAGRLRHAQPLLAQRSIEPFLEWAAPGSTVAAEPALP